MGFLGSLFKAITPQQAARPNMTEILYPGWLPSFEELERNNHTDPRALVYQYDGLNAERKKMPFSIDNLSEYSDFTNRTEMYKALKEAGLIQELSRAEELADRFSQDELKKKLRDMGLKTGGKKVEQAERLLNNGYKFTRSRKKKFTFTAKGVELWRQKRKDRQDAATKAAGALQYLAYDIAVKAYREYDNKWGFAHIGGKKHTIFAHYDIPYERFRFFETYPMREVLNSDSYKKTLRAVLIAGLMRGCQEEWELTFDFERICKEPLNCQKLFTLFNGYSPEVLANMRDQADGNNQTALAYYISNLEYRSRQNKIFEKF